jgi:glycosyltransferase involved in cell wall biosynthesis
MRIAFVNSSRRREGGIETYLQTVIPVLGRLGHEVSLCYELDAPSERETIELPPGAPAWCVSELGVGNTVAALRQWRPDVIYSHNVTNIELESELLKVAPAVFFAHAYYGTCISGSKAFKLPIARPCSRQFGWQCVLQFYPKRCGGLNPVKMLTLYRAQSNRLELLRKYRAVITHSEHLRAEYIRHGIAAERVLLSKFCVEPLRSDALQDSPEAPKRTANSKGTWRLVFAGRMDRLKGGLLLLKALPLVRSAAGRPLKLVFAGDGPERRVWDSAAMKLNSSTHGICAEFAGWLGEAELKALFRNSHLLVVPSIWPEPFGIVGVQAASEGVPAAAFAVGGIPTWLTDGVNGHLAPGNPPTPEGLAGAILKCLTDDEHHLDLCRGAAESANRFTVQAHVAELVRLLEGAAA